VYLLLRTHFEKFYIIRRYFFTNRWALISLKYLKISKIIRNKRSIMSKYEWENTNRLFSEELEEKSGLCFGE
jgi:hypothetical protein